MHLKMNNLECYIKSTTVLGHVDPSPHDPHEDLHSDIYICIYVHTLIKVQKKVLVRMMNFKCGKIVIFLLFWN